MPATLTHSPLIPQNPAEVLRADTRDTRKWMMNPLPGICPTHRTPRGYRHASPHGDRLRLGIEGYHFDAPRPTANYSLLTANSSFASGWQTFSYGKLGELTENIRTFALPFEDNTYTFKMQYRYDSYNRIQTMTYPDGEVVHYGYNRGGMLKRVTGDKNGDTYKYIEEIRYNPFEQKEKVYYGNGTRTYYNYDVLRRLIHLRSVCADGTMQDINYDYDEVSNISKIVNSAAMLPTGLGGTYGSQFTYDNLYRLAYAEGDWHGNNTLFFETSIEYEKNGRISRKVSHADTWLDGNYAAEIYDNEYHYNNSQPNTLSYINNTSQQSFEWDSKGNLVFHHNGQAGYDRSLCWGEQNRLLGVTDKGGRFSYYQYDAGGERTFKSSGEYTAQNLSGQWHCFYRLDKSTLYASPYLVATRQGYTKHYYAESERIASRIGGGGLTELSEGMENDPDKSDLHREQANILLERTAECLDATIQPQWDVLSYLYEWREIREEEKECYWYHPDHLGSSSWITFSDGNAVQHLHYLPWGEDFVDQRSTSWNAMYTFSAKEKDTETGYSYFGSRYYNSNLSIWLSVDPMSDKYASTSPYAYCRNNPIILYDPNGMFDDWVMDKNGQIYWDENAKNQETTKQGETYLGKEGQHSIGTRVWNYHGDRTYDEQEPVIINGNSPSDINRSANTSPSYNHNQIDKIDNAISTTSIVTTLPVGAAAESVAKTASKIALKGLGGIISVATVIPDIVRWRNEPTVENRRKVLVSTGGALISFIPIIGPVGSVIWGSIDAGGGFDRYYKNTNKNKNKKKNKKK